MIKNDALNEVFDLSHRWECLTNDLFDDEFDYEFFKPLAVHTFAFLFPYHAAENLPREMMSVLFKIKEFASCPVGVSKESNAAQLVATEFCNQIEDCWIQIDGIFDENCFVVADNYGVDHFIDTNTFDLSDMF